MRDIDTHFVDVDGAALDAEAVEAVCRRGHRTGRYARLTLHLESKSQLIRDRGRVGAVVIGGDGEFARIARQGLDVPRQAVVDVMASHGDPILAEVKIGFGGRARFAYALDVAEPVTEQLSLALAEPAA